MTGGRILGPRAAAIVAGYVAVFFGVLPAALWTIGGRLDRWLALPPVPPAARLPLGLPVALAGGALMLRAMFALWLDGGGLPISHLPPVRLVSSGPFARLRHPIYVGYTLAFAGAGVACGSYGRGAGAAALLTIAWLAYAAGIEEPALRRRFGVAREARAPVLLPLWRALRPAAEWIAARPVLFTTGRTLWVTYGAWVAVAAAAGTALAIALLGDVPPRALDELAIGLAVGLPLGGRLVWLGYHAGALVRRPGETLRRVGFVSFGAYAATLAVCAAWRALRAPALPLGAVLDRAIVAGYLSTGLGRLGCLSYGCCYGRPWPPGLRVRDPRAKVVRERGAAGELPRWPTQLLSAGWGLAVGGMGLALLGRSAPAGVTAALVVLVYGLGRFGLESLRDEERLWGGRLTHGQLLAAAFALGAAVWLVGVDPGGARKPVVVSWSSPLEHLGALALAAALVFVGCGYHRGALGRW